MSDDTPTMSRAEALEELGHRYRIRCAVTVEHEGRFYSARGSTMVATAAAVEGAATELLGVILDRALEQLAEPIEPPA